MSKHGKSHSGALKKFIKTTTGTSYEQITTVSRSPKKSELYVTLKLKENEKLGITLQPFIANKCIVKSVKEDSIAHWAGVKKGWIVIAVDGRDVKSDQAFKLALEGAMKTSKECEITFNKLKPGKKEVKEEVKEEVKVSW